VHAKKIKHTFDSCKRSHPLRVQHHGHLSVFYDEIITRMQSSCNMSTTWLNVYTVVDPNPVIRWGPSVSPGKNNAQWNPALQPPQLYSHVVITATFSGRLAKTTIHFLVKKPLLLRSPRYYGQIFFGPLVTILMGFHCMLELNGPVRAHFLPSVINPSTLQPPQGLNRWLL